VGYSPSGKGRRVSPEQRKRNRVYGRKAWLHVRALVLARDHHVCHYCGGRANSVDHLHPLVRGGTPYDPRNLVAACVRCNSARVRQEFATRSAKNFARQKNFRGADFGIFASGKRSTEVPGGIGLAAAEGALSGAERSGADGRRIWRGAIGLP